MGNGWYHPKASIRLRNQYRCAGDAALAQARKRFIGLRRA